MRRNFLESRKPEDLPHENITNREFYKIFHEKQAEDTDAQRAEELNLLREKCKEPIFLSVKPEDLETNEEAFIQIPSLQQVWHNWNGPNGPGYYETEAWQIPFDKGKGKGEPSSSSSGTGRDQAYWLHSGLKPENTKALIISNDPVVCKSIGSLF